MRNSGLQVGILALLLVAILPQACWAEGVFSLVAQEAREQFFTADATMSKAIPPDGYLCLFCTFNDSEFAIEEMTQLSVETPSGKLVPLFYDESSVLTEFGEIYSVRFFFIASVVDVESPKPFKIKWGDGVESSNIPVTEFKLAVADIDKFREVVWVEEGAANPDSLVASVQVIADSSSDYYSLWYLLPMLVLFIILTLRKHRIRVESHK